MKNVSAPTAPRAMSGQGPDLADHEVLPETRSEPVSSRSACAFQTAIAGLPQGHERTERNHNPRVGGSSPSSATCAWRRIRPHHTAQVRNWQGLGRLRFRPVTRWTEYVVLVSGPSVYRASMAFDSKGFSAGDRRNPMQGGIARPSSVPRRLSQVV